MAFENVVQYLQGLLDMPRQHRLAVAAIWGKLRDDLGRDYWWARVKGPLSRAIATLWDLDFIPTAYDEWVDREGTAWKLDLDDPCLVHARLEVLEVRFTQTMWTTAAAEHTDPLGVQPDITAYKQLSREYRNDKQHTHA